MASRQSLHERNSNRTTHTDQGSSFSPESKKQLVVKNQNIEALMYFLLREFLHTGNAHATGKDTANTYVYNNF